MKNGCNRKSIMRMCVFMIRIIPFVAYFKNGCIILYSLPSCSFCSLSSSVCHALIGFHFPAFSTDTNGGENDEKAQKETWEISVHLLS